MRNLVTALALVFFASTSLAAHANPSGWDLAREVIMHREGPTRELVTMLHSQRPEDAARAAKVIRVIGVGHPAVFLTLLSRADIGFEARAAVRIEIARMPARSPSRARLLAMAEQAESVADARRAP